MTQPNSRQNVERKLVHQALHNAQALWLVSAQIDVTCMCHHAENSAHLQCINAGENIRQIMLLSMSNARLACCFTTPCFGKSFKKAT